MTIAEFMEQSPDSNQDFAAQLIIQHFAMSEFSRFHAVVKQLDEILYKSYLKDLTVNDLVEISRTIKSLKP